MVSIGKAGSIDTALQGSGNICGSGSSNGIPCCIQAGTALHMDNYSDYLWVHRTPLPMGLHCQNPLTVGAKLSKEPEAQQMAFRDATEPTQSSSMSWENWVQEEEEQKRCSPMEGSPNLGSSPPPLESDNVSDVSMVNDSLLQCDSDVVIEEEREESMETDVPHDSTVPTPLKEKSMSEDFKAGDPNDHCSHTSEESTDQNPPHNSNPDEDELLGPVTDISVPRGHSR